MGWHRDLRLTGVTTAMQRTPRYDPHEEMTRKSGSEVRQGVVIILSRVGLVSPSIYPALTTKSLRHCFLCFSQLRMSSTIVTSFQQHEPNHSTPHRNSPHCTAPHRAILCHTAPRLTTPHHSAPHRKPLHCT